MAGGAEGESRSLEQTPTWAVAAVCLVFVVISICIEQAIHLIGKWLKKRHKTALNEALEKIKAELMLLGFISLLLTVGQKPISMICISERMANTLLPCKKKDTSSYAKNNHEKDKYLSTQGYHRKLLWGDDSTFNSNSMLEKVPFRRILAAAGGSEHCANKGMVPLVSQDGMHQLHIFIFVLAVFQVLHCILTLALGRAKMKRWEAWEKETRTLEYELSHDPARYRFMRETSFGRRHLRFWTRTPILIWIVCFFRQFIRSVPKVDYLTLRHGFILAHLSPHSNFDFHKYIKRSLDDDFKIIVGISPSLWFSAVIFLFLNGHGWYTYFWLSFVPLIIILIVGTKLQVIITKMGLQIQDTHAVVKGTPVVQPNDEWFWFGRPQWVLYLIHFTLFQNAFQLAFFFWAWYEFGLKSCFHERFEDIITRLAMGVGVQFLCSYITLPLYALVIQMGTNMKKAIFEEQTAKALRRWHQATRKKLKRNRKSGSQSGFTSGQSTPTQGLSPIHLLHRYKSTGDLELSAQNSARFYHSECEMSDLEMQDAIFSSSCLQSIPKYSIDTLCDAKAQRNKLEATVQHLKPDASSSTEGIREQHPTPEDPADPNNADFSFAKL